MAYYSPLYDSDSFHRLVYELDLIDRMNSNIIENNVSLLSKFRDRYLFSVANAKGEIIGYWKVFLK